MTFKNTRQNKPKAPPAAEQADPVVRISVTLTEAEIAAADLYAILNGTTRSAYIGELIRKHNGLEDQIPPRRVANRPKAEPPAEPTPREARRKK